MNFPEDFCKVCSKRDMLLENVCNKDSDGISIKQKLQYCLSGDIYNTNDLICKDCNIELDTLFKFKQRSFGNITIRNKYIQQLSTEQTMVKNLSVKLNKVKIYYLPSIEVSNAEEDCSSSELDENDTSNEINFEEKWITLDDLISGEHELFQKNNNSHIYSDNISEIEIKPEFKETVTACDTIPNQNILETSENNQHEDMFEVEMKQEVVTNYDLETSQETSATIFDSDVKIKNECEKTVTDCDCEHHETGKKKVRCNYCFKFFTGCYLARHLAVHTNSRPFKCNICGNKFKLATALARHKFIHKGLKPYSCFCGVVFSRLDHMQNHQRKIHGMGRAGKQQKVTEDIKIVDSDK